MATPKKVRKDRIEVDHLREVFADYPAIDILERRRFDPDVPTTVAVRLKDEPTERQDPTGNRRKWYLRWVNTEIPQRLHTLLAGKGYVKVEWDELRDVDQVADAARTDAFVRRGDRGREVLVKIPKAYADEIRRVTEERRAAKSRHPGATREALAERAAGTLGPEAGDAVMSNFVGDVLEHTEPPQA